MRRLLPILLLLSLLGFPPALVRAQTGAYAEIASVDAGGFPKVSALVDVFDASGGFQAGLRPGDLTAYENGEPRPVDALRQTEVPVQLVVAINPGPSLAVRDANAVARFEKVVATLSQWVNAQPSDSGDDLSLVSLSGSLITHAGGRDWLVSLDSFKPDFRNTTPNLQTFSIALDTVTAPTPQPGMKRAILFITPHMDDPDIDATIAPLIERAVDARVRVFVWFVDGDVYFNTASANAFRSLALQTHGSLFAFSGAEEFPDLDTELDPLRHIYALTYTSSLNTSGSHEFHVEVETSEGTIRAPDQRFSVEIEPPNPILVSPPLQIRREPPADDPYNDEILLPERETLEIIVEFPDGHPRDLVRTALNVDGEVVDENTSEPFGTFVWDLSQHDSTGTHELSVEAEDVLGLQKSSIVTRVTLTVIHPPTGIQAFLARYRSYLVLGAIGLAGMALLAIILVGRSGGELFKRRRQKRRQFEDPLTQPVDAVAEPRTSPVKKPKAASRRTGWLQVPQRAPRLPDAPAYLRRLTNGGEPASLLPIPILEKDMTFGTDPVQSIRVLDDPSISPLHARIRQRPDGFYIYDHGSVAGTWVNYEPVTREGRRLAHGDRIHLGQLLYRFDLKQPPAQPEPRIISTGLNS